MGAHLDHADGFAEVLAGVVGVVGVGGGTDIVRVADLGSGGGVPALPLALAFPGWVWTLVEASVRRAAFLRDSVGALGLAPLVHVVEDRAEVVGRCVEYRGRFDMVVARSFGPPAVVAECGAPLLRVGGVMVVSEPPGGSPGRWLAASLAVLGLAPEATVSGGRWAYQVVRQVSPCPERYPRRVGVPVKRPLF